MTDDSLVPALKIVASKLSGGVPLDSELAERIIDIVKDAVLVVDSAGMIVMANLPATYLTGYPRAQLLGMKVEALVPDGTRDHHEQYRTKFFNEPVPRPMGAGRPLAIRQKSGPEIPVDIELNPVVTAEGSYAIAIIRRK